MYHYVTELNAIGRRLFLSLLIRQTLHAL